MFKELAKERKLPELQSREEMLEILFSEEYGYLPKKPEELSFEAEEVYPSCNCGGMAKEHRITVKGKIDGREFSFPFYSVIPVKEGKYPFFVHINFRDGRPDRYMPTEELIDEGFAVLSFCYNDVTKDNGDFTDGLAGVLYPDGVRGKKDAGKIAMWAWAAHRVLDWAETNEKLDMKRSIVCGHSRLGKTALFAGATDERFAVSYSNDSGCSGASITRGKRGETVEVITRVFPFWFCEDYRKYADREYEMPFDQHYLIGAIAPRYACIGSATEDEWADPEAEQFACYAASGAYKAHGIDGYIGADRYARTGESFFEGNIGYHLREGVHYFSRRDWLKLIEFVRAKGLA